jgi:hypothetical protein
MLVAMDTSLFDPRQAVARALVIALLPAPLVLFLATRSIAVAGVALLLFVVVFEVAVGWLFPRHSRIDAALELLPTLVTMVVAPVLAFFFTFLQLCSIGDDGVTYLSGRGALLAGGALALTYVAGSSWALARAPRFAWAWPLAVAVAIGVGLAALALVEGGPHQCYT